MFLTFKEVLCKMRCFLLRVRLNSDGNLKFQTVLERLVNVATSPVQSFRNDDFIVFSVARCEELGSR